MVDPTAKPTKHKPDMMMFQPFIFWTLGIVTATTIMSALVLWAKIVVALLLTGAYFLLIKQFNKMEEKP